MSIQEAAKEFAQEYKTEREKNLETKIEELENIIKELSERITWLEYQVNVK